MARETFLQNQRVIRALNVHHGDRVLDIGCGPGRTLAELARLVGHCHVDGVDPSELMVKIATRRNSSAIKAGLVGISTASADRLPFDAETFDRALCVHVLYFWTNVDVAIAEIARVMKKGGLLALLFRSAEDVRAVQKFPKEIYRFPEVDAILAALEASGFDAALLSPVGGHSSQPNLVLATRRM